MTRMTTELSDICVYNAKLEGKGFVGLQFENGDLKVMFPLGYRSADTDDERRKDILNLISVLETFMEKDSSMNSPKSENKKTESGFPIQAYIRIIIDFLNHGYYHEYETEYRNSLSGKICWNKTIKTIRPEFVGNDILYLNFITKKSQNNEAALITQIHKFFVYEAFFKLGFLFCSFMPEKPQIIYNKKLFRSVVEMKLEKTFSDRNLILFNDMKLIMDYLDASDSNMKNYRYGTEEFEYIWEKLVDRVYGISNKEDYYPHTEWHIAGKVFGNNDVDYKKNALRPDTIMLIKNDRGEKEAFVLDSKYYKYGELRESYSLPGTDSIIKQIAYGKYIENNKKHSDLNVDGNNIYNAFILPYDSSGHACEVFGYATTTYESNDKPYHKIYGVMLDIKDLMYHHARLDDSSISILANTIKGFIEKS